MNTPATIFTMTMLFRVLIAGCTAGFIVLLIQGAFGRGSFEKQPFWLRFIILFVIIEFSIFTADLLVALL